MKEDKNKLTLQPKMAIHVHVYHKEIDTPVYIYICYFSQIYIEDKAKMKKKSCPWIISMSHKQFFYTTGIL